MAKKYDGWCLKMRGQRYFLFNSFHEHRRDTLKWRNENLEPSREWFRETGSKSSKYDLYKIVKVKLVEVTDGE